MQSVVFCYCVLGRAGRGGGWGVELKLRTVLQLRRQRRQATQLLAMTIIAPASFDAVLARKRSSSLVVELHEGEHSTTKIWRFDKHLEREVESLLPHLGRLLSN